MANQEQLVAHPNIAFIEVLRASACLLVVYTHVLAGRASFYNYDWWPYVAIRDYVVTPAGIIQNFGYFGVALFFIISGFIITHSTQNETRLTFFIKRTARIYPPLIAAALFAALLYAIDGYFRGQLHPLIQIDSVSVLHSAFATNVFAGTNGTLVVSWTLAVELLFYLLVLAALPLLRRGPLAALAFFILAPTFLIHMTFRYGVSHIAPLLEHLPIFALGMAVYYGWSGRLPLWAAALGCIAAWVATVHNFWLVQPWNLQAPPTSHTVQVAYVFVTFVGTLIAMRHVAKNPRVVRFFSDISYSLYLLHYPIGVLLMDALYPHIGFTAAAVISLSACIGASYVSFRYLEEPTKVAARNLIAMAVRKSQTPQL